MVETFRVKGMHCAACASAVERILKKQEGIQDAQVNLVSEQVTVTSDRYLTLEPLVQALGKAGYELERIEAPNEVNLAVEGMHCAACSAAVERILKKQPDVIDAQVNLVNEQVYVRYVGEKDVAHWKRPSNRYTYRISSEREGTGTVERDELSYSGMHCASCSSACERMLSKLDGVKEASVNLVNEQAHVVYDPRRVKQSEMFAAIAKRLSGRGDPRTAGSEGRKGKQPGHDPHAGAGRTASLHRHVAYAAGPAAASGHHPLCDTSLNFALIQLILTTVILFMGRDFYIRGIPALLHRVPKHGYAGLHRYAECVSVFDLFADPDRRRQSACGARAVF